MTISEDLEAAVANNSFPLHCPFHIAGNTRQVEISYNCPPNLDLYIMPKMGESRTLFTAENKRLSLILIDSLRKHEVSVSQYILILHGDPTVSGDAVRIHMDTDLEIWDGSKFSYDRKTHFARIDNALTACKYIPPIFEGLYRYTKPPVPKPSFPKSELQDDKGSLFYRILRKLRIVK